MKDGGAVTAAGLGLRIAGLLGVLAESETGWPGYVEVLAELGEA